MHWACFVPVAEAETAKKMGVYSIYLPADVLFFWRLSRAESSGRSVIIVTLSGRIAWLSDQIVFLREDRRRARRLNGNGQARLAARQVVAEAETKQRAK
jgi:hypothetical protein